MNEKVGDIIENSTGPFRVVVVREYGDVTFASLEPVEGPLTKRQHEYREAEQKWDEHRAAKAAALRERIRQRLEERITPSILPRWDGSAEEVKPLIDVIVELIHEESEY